MPASRSHVAQVEFCDVARGVEHHGKVAIYCALPDLWERREARGTEREPRRGDCACECLPRDKARHA